MPNMGYALMGNGNGTFRGAPHTATTSMSSLVDLNGDGKLDYVGALQPIAGGQNQLLVDSLATFLGNGDGSFKTPAPITLSPFTYNGASYSFLAVSTFVLVDVNGDGHPDIVAAPYEYANNVSPSRLGLLIALGNGDGTFQAPVFSPYPSLLANGGPDSIVQAGGLKAATRADGKTELFYSFETQDTSLNKYDQGFAMQVVNGNGSFGTAAITNTITNAAAASPEIAVTELNLVDLNGDKTPDLIGYVDPSPPYPPQLLVFLGNTDGTFASAHSLNITPYPGYYPLAVADMNGDGKMDLVELGATASGGQFEIAVALGNGDGTFQTPQETPLSFFGTPLDPVVAADFDGDGKVDVAILGDYPPYDSGIFPGNGDGTLQSVSAGGSFGAVYPPQAINLAAQTSRLVADVNGDGRPDLVGSTVLINQYGVPLVVAAVGTAMSLSISAAAATAGQTVTLTATVTAASGTVVPTGTVTFLSGTTSLGTGTLNAQGVATLALSTLAAGSYSLTASYPANANFNGSVSSAVTLVVSAAVPADFSVSLNPASASVASGSQAQTTVTVSPTGGFSQAVGLSCSGLPANASCAFSSPSVTPAGAAATTTVTITTGQSQTASQTKDLPGLPGGRLLGGISLSGLLALVFFKTGRTRRLLCLLLCIGYVGLMIGCSGSNSNGTTNLTSSTKTPSGTYMISLSGTSGTTTHSASFALTVQ